MSLFNKIILITCLLFGFTAHGQGTIPTVGNDFWLGFMSNYDGATQLNLFVSSNVATTGVVSIPQQGWSLNFTVAANVTTTVTIPVAMAEHLTNDVIDTKGVHVTTADSVSLFGINLRNYTADASRILPIQSLGTNYIVSSYKGLSGYSYKSEFLIVATEDGTQVEITPTVATQGGYAAGIPYLVNLDQGESYQVKAASGSTDLTGTTVNGTALSGDCRPFAVFGGSGCTYIPTTCTACDHIFDQMFPVETWGDEYYIVPFTGTTGFTYRIIARDNGTSVTINGGAPLAMTAGQILEFNNVNTTIQVVSNNPISVIQFMEGFSCSGVGDPCMLGLNASSQQINQVTFSTVTSTIITQHNLTLIVETADVGVTQLDNVPIPAASYNSFPSNPLKSYTQVTLAQGSHSLFAPNGFTAYVYGTGSAESYAYSVGSFQDEPVPLVDTLLCSNDTMVLVPNQILFSSVWTALSDTTIVLGNGSSLTLYPPIISDIYMVTGNSLISGCQDEFLFSVASPTPPVFTLDLVGDTVCRYSNVQMGANIVSPGTFQYEWQPAHLFDNSTIANPVYTAEQSGWIYLTVSGNGGICSSATDSLYIEVIGGGISQLTAMTDITDICLPDTAQLSFETMKIRSYEDFEGGISPTMWTSTTGAITSNLCGSFGGDALYFNGTGTRTAETADFDVSLGGNVQFYIKIADGLAPCDDTELGDDVIFEYSTNGGTTWTTISTLFEYSYPNFTQLTIAIPALAQTTATRFRWRQALFDGLDLDIWALDNVVVNAIDNSGLNFTWSPATSVSDPLSLTPQAFPSTPTWFILEIDDAGCIYSDSVFIDVDPGFLLTTTDDTTLCTVQSLLLNTTPTQGSGHTYTWSPQIFVTNTSGGDLTVLPTATTTYYVTVTSPQGCTQNDSVTVFSNGVEVVLSADTMICIGLPDTLLATFNVPMTNYTYQWSDPNGGALGSSPQAIVLPTVSGYYVFTTIDTVSSCVSNDSIYIATSPAFSITSTTDSVYCGTQNIQLSAIPDVPGNYSYSWNPSPDLGSLTDSVTTATILASSSYIVNITSADGCSISDTISIGIVGDPGVNIVGDTVLCLGDSTTLIGLVSNDLSDSFENSVVNPLIWGSTTGAALNTNCGSISGNALHFNGAGTRSATTIDLNLVSGGQINFAIVFGTGGAPCENADAGEDVVLEYSTNGGGGPWTQMGLYDESIYTVFTSLIVPIPVGAQTTSTRFRWRQIAFSGMGNDNWALDDVSITTNTLGNYVYQWYDPINQAIPGGDTITIWPTTSGIYSLIALDTNAGCQLFNEQFIEVIEFDVNAGNDTTVCSTNGYMLQGSSLAVSPTVSWENAALLNGSSTFTPTIQFDTSSVYILSVTQAGCTITDSVVVSNISAFQLPIPQDTTICSGDSFPLDLTGASSINWTPNASIQGGTSTNPVFTPTSSTLYYVDYEDLNLCGHQDSINVIVIPLPTVTLPNDTTLCIGSNLLIQSVVNVSGPTYLWSTGDTLADIIIDTAGIYWVEISANCGIHRDTMVVNEFQPQMLDLGNDTILCQGENVMFVVTEPVGGIISWFDASSNDTIIITTPTTVWVELEDVNGCTVSDTVEVTYFPIVPYDLGPDVFYCAGDSLIIGDTTAQLQTYNWSTNETSALITVNSPGVYSVENIDTNGCMIFDTITVFEYALPIPLIVGPTTYCDYDTVTYSENGSFPSYEWYNTETTNSITQYGPIDVISVQVIDANGCIGYDSLEVTMIDVPELFLGVDLIICDSNIVLDATVPLADSYLWSTLETTPMISAGIGTYTVDVMYGICTITETVSVGQVEIPFNLGPDFTICEDDNIILGHELFAIDSIIWNDGTNTTLYEYTAPFDVYDTIAISAIAHGCGFAYDTVVVIVEDCDCPVFVPNTFTPNGDEYNNVLRVRSDCTLDNFNFILFNRWGGIIFETNTIEFEWDGTAGNGQRVQDGTYTWKMTYHIVNNVGKEIVRNKVGHVNVLK